MFLNDIGRSPPKRLDVFLRFVQILIFLYKSLMTFQHTNKKEAKRYPKTTA